MKRAALFLITALGLILRVHNISPFKLYPDSYQNLLVAENIRVYQSVLGRLGENGMLYPDFFMWTRPMYAILINLVHFFGIDTTRAAQSIALIAGVIAIPLVYFFLQSLFKSRTVGLAGAALLTVSFNHIIWSGFVMTETAGVLFMILSLWSFFSSLKKNSSPMDYLTGVFFALAVMTRYEYAVVLFPMIVFILLNDKYRYRRLVKILSSFLFSIVVVAITLFPIHSANVLFNQLPDLILIGTGLGLITLVTIYLRSVIPSGAEESHTTKVLKHQHSMRSLHSLRSVGMTKWLTYLLLATVFFLAINEKTAIGSFVRHDLLLSISFLFGIVVMLQQKKLKSIGLFVLSSVVFLGIFYYRTNPEMERYMTHLIPFLLIPASYGLMKLIHFKHMTKIAIIFLLLTQSFISYNGLRYLHDESWFRTSYEEKAARKVKEYGSKNDLLLASLPEPYFYETQLSTHSITDTPPYIYLPNSLDQKTIIIVEDMGMREVFPNFTKMIETKLKDKKIAHYWVHEHFHILNKSKEETHPVVLYKTTVGELKKRIDR